MLNYETLNTEETEALHKIQLEIFKEFILICKELNLKYYVIGGTALGTLRHGGFIPWDDDIDVGMPRSSYELFLKEAPKIISNQYFIQTHITDRFYPHNFAKIRDNNTTFIERNVKHLDINHGVYIDIFPLDNVPISRFKQFIQKHKVYVLKRILLVKMNYKIWRKGEYLKQLIYKTLEIISLPLKINQIKKQLYKIMISNNYKSSDKVVAFGGAYGYEKESIKREWVENLIEVDFENEKFLAPISSVDYLTYFYGDFMTPPPENKRYNRHEIIEVCFEEEK